MRPGDNRGHRGVGKDRGVMEERGGVDLSVDNSGSLDHRLDNWGMGDSGNRCGEGGEGGGGKAGDGVEGRVEEGSSSWESVEGSHSWGSNRGGGSEGEGGRGGHSGGSSDSRGGGSDGEGGGGGLDHRDHGGSGGDGVNKSILVQVLRESLKCE